MSEWREELKVELIYYQTGTSQRPGGQQAGMPATAVRVTHLPTGIMAQGEFGYRSQHKARQIAIEMVEWGLTAFGYLGTPASKSLQNIKGGDESGG